MSLFDPFGLGEYRRPLWRCESTLNPRQDPGAFSPTGIRFKRHDVHPRKFLPLVEMLKAKYKSLWSSLSFSKQKKLLTLLEQMKPEEQDCLLRVMKKQERMSPYLFVYRYYMSSDKLLSLLTRLHSTDRSHLLRRLESMDPQEQKKLIRVMDRLEESERVELLGVLDRLESLEQKILLNVMLNKTYHNELDVMLNKTFYSKMVLKCMKTRLPVDRSRLLRVLDGLDSTSQHCLLRVLEHSSQCHELIDHSNLLRQLESMDRQEQTKLICVMDGLKESEQVELLGILDELEVLERQILLSVLNARYPAVHYETALKFTKSLLPVDRSRLQRLLDGLDSTSQRGLLKMLEHSSQCHVLIDRSNLLRQLESMDLQEQEKLISVMDSLEESEWLKLLGHLDELETLDQSRLLNVLNPMYHQSRLWNHRRWNPVYYHEMMLNLKPMKISLRVDPSRLLRVLDGLDSTSRHGLLKILEHSSQRVLRRLESMDPQEQTKFINVMGSVQKSERVELLGILDKLEAHEQQILLNVLNTTHHCGLGVVLKWTKSVPTSDRSRLLRVLDGVGSTSKCRLLKVLEYSSQHYELIDQSNLLRRLEPLDPVRQWELIKALAKQCAFLYKADVVKNLLQREGYLSLDRSSLLQYLDCLDPLERKQLPKVLSELAEPPWIACPRLSSNVQPFSKVATYGTKGLKEMDVYSMLSGAYALLKQMEYESLLQQLLLLFVCLLSIYLSEADPQGGFRNLLLDGWWLEFWEIILLAAGDVEKNPGPTFMTEKELAVVSIAIIEEDDLSDIFDNVLPISSKWLRFCSILGLRPSLLDTISKNHHGDCEQCLFEGVKHWLQGNYNTEKHGQPTWRKLVAAVDNSAGGNNHALAKTIAEKHKVLPTVPSQLQAVDRSREDLEEMSSSFNIMYRSVVRLLRNVDVGEVKDHLCYLTVPKEFDKLCVPPHVYECAATTKDLMGQLCPQYINPGNTFVLKEIVTYFGSHRCKRLVQEYINKFM